MILLVGKRRKCMKKGEGGGVESDYRRPPVQWGYCIVLCCVGRERL